ncbi:hypothetical protein IDS74_004207 [Escherichia coli]|nr:hypothetical protein [Escherichia coli]
MKQQYQTRYELLHENYQKWLTGFTRHAVYREVNYLILVKNPGGKWIKRDLMG